MSVMSDIHITICEMLESTLFTDAEIAEALKIPIEWVVVTREDTEDSI